MKIILLILLIAGCSTEAIQPTMISPVGHWRNDTVEPQGTITELLWIEDDGIFTDASGQFTDHFIVDSVYSGTWFTSDSNIEFNSISRGPNIYKFTIMEQVFTILRQPARVFYLE